MPNEIKLNDSVYVMVTNEPIFPGGTDSMVAFIVETIAYPEEAIEKNEQGIVYVQFIVEKDGALRDITIRKGASPSLDKEAMRVVSEMPNWVPGSLESGEIVAVQYTLPIHFRLSGTGKEEAPEEKKKKWWQRKK